MCSRGLVALLGALALLLPPALAAEGAPARKLLQFEGAAAAGLQTDSGLGEAAAGSEALSLDAEFAAAGAGAAEYAAAADVDVGGDGTQGDSMDLGNTDQMASLYSRHVEPAMLMAEKHLYPQLQKHSTHMANLKESTQKLFFEAHGRMTAHLTRLTGHDAELVPTWLQYLSYVTLLMPLAVWLLLLAYFFTQMAMAGIVFTLAKCGNLFWTIYCLFLAIMTFVISDEPLFFFHQNHPSEYVAFQFVKAGLFALHLLVLLVQCVSDVSFLNVVQWVGATLIGVHYYLNAWHPAMMEEPPLLGFKYYAFYMYCFFIFFILPSSGRYLYKYRHD